MYEYREKIKTTDVSEIENFFATHLCVYVIPIYFGVHLVFSMEFWVKIKPNLGIVWDYFETRFEIIFLEFSNENPKLREFLPIHSPN